MKAKALTFHGPRSIAIEEVDLPDLEEGKILVRARYSGISGGTEMLAYRGEVDPDLALDDTLGALRGTFTFPFRYGYSCVGTVERSRGRIPVGASVFAFHPHQDVLVVGEAEVVSVEGASPRAATLFPLVETALQATLDCGARQGEVVAVLGLGAVGLLTAALLCRGGARAIGSDPRPWRRRAGAAMGVPTVRPEELPPAVARATDGRGADLVVEASGDPAALVEALDLLAHEGTALVCSWYGSRTAELPLGRAFHRRRLTIRSSQVSTIPSSLRGRWDLDRRRATARSLLRELPLEVIATHVFPFERADEAYRAIDRGEEGLIHAALEYP